MQPAHENPLILAASAISNDEVLACLREYESQKRVCDSENGVLRNIVKRHKAAGVNIPALMATCKARKREPMEVVAELREQIRYMSLRNIPVARETLFDGWTPRVSEKSRDEEDIWTAEDSGYRAGRHGVDISENPYSPGIELHAAWLKWWQKGQAAIARELGPDTEQAPASRIRRPRQMRFPGTDRRKRPAEEEKGNGHAAEAPPKRGRGRPKGSKNRPPAAPAEVTASIN